MTASYELESLWNEAAAFLELLEHLREWKEEKHEKLQSGETISWTRNYPETSKTL